MECELNPQTATATGTNMVAILQSRRDALEAKLREKTSELKQLCLKEAELTGILPPETPFDPGESPKFVRRRFMSFIGSPRSSSSSAATKSTKDEELLYQLEIEYKRTSQNGGDERRLSELSSQMMMLKQCIAKRRQQEQKKRRISLPQQNSTRSASPIGTIGSDNSGQFYYDDTKTQTFAWDQYPIPSYHQQQQQLQHDHRHLIRNHQFYSSFGRPSTACGHREWNRNNHHRRSMQQSHHNSACYDIQQEVVY